MKYIHYFFFGEYEYEKEMNWFYIPLLVALIIVLPIIIFI